MALECKKTPAAGLVVSNLTKASQDDNEQQLTVSGMNPEGNEDNNAIIPSSISRRNTKADIDIREVYFLIMHFLSEGPCRKACAQLKEELEEHKLLPRRYHAWYSREGVHSGEIEDDGISVPLSFPELFERFSFIERNHLVKLLEELVNSSTEGGFSGDAKNPTAADASTLLGTGSVSLLKEKGKAKPPVLCCNRGGQVYGLTMREIGGGLPRHHRPPSVRGASYHIVKPSVLVNRIQMIKTFRGHLNAVYCAIFDKTGEHIITGSDDRLVKIWSTTTGFCLCSCRGHDGDITDLAVSANNLLMASASNDCFIRVWRFPDGLPVAVLKGHTCAVTAIAFSPRLGCEHHLLSTSDDGTCRIWDARDSTVNARIYAPRPEGQEFGGKIPESGPSNVQSRTQILCCAFNASGTVFVTGSSDKLARVWDACKWSDEVHGVPNYEIDTLKGHEDDVNYVQFSGCAAPARPDNRPVNYGGQSKNDRVTRFRNSWYGYESIVSCSRDGTAIIWVPRSRKYHGKSRWAKGYHLRVPPPPTPPQPPRGVPRQRLLPTPRGVNMIVWSLDNRYVLAAIMDCRICVWNAVDGSLVHSLTGHTKSTFVLDVHPYDPRIAMSAGYDGRVIIWDIWEGRSIHVYQMGEFHLVDGKFSPDGTSIVISDEVGQIYLLATGEGRSQKDAKYDQFFLGDYRPLIRDVYGNVLDQDTQLSPHQRNVHDLLCDANRIPYPEPYQTMYQQRRLGAIGITWQPPPTQWITRSMDDTTFLAPDLALLVPPEEEEAPEAQQGGARWVEQPADDDIMMDWEQDSVDDAGSDYTVSFDNACDDDERECSLASSEEFLDSLEDEDSSDDEHNHRASLRRSERNKKKEEEASTSGGRSSKRKRRDGGREPSLRRSKRHQKNKKSKRYASKRTVEGEPSRRRPKRLAAKNARLIFSRISAEESERSSANETSHEMESEGDERLSSKESFEKDDINEELERIDEDNVTEHGQSHTRTRIPGRLRFSTRKSLHEGTSNTNGDTTVEEQPYSVCDAVNENIDSDNVKGYEDNTEFKDGYSPGHTPGSLEEKLLLHNSDVGPSSSKWRRERKPSKLRYSDKGKCIDEDLSDGVPLADYCSDFAVVNNMQEHLLDRGVPAGEMSTPETKFDGAYEHNSPDMNGEGDRDMPDERANLRSNLVKEEHSEEQDVKVYGEGDGPENLECNNNKNKGKQAYHQGHTSSMVEDELHSGDKEANTANTSCPRSPVPQKRPIKVIISGPRKQPMGTSWQHNSPTCLWLRECTAEARFSESPSEDERISDGENAIERNGHGDQDSAEHHLNLSFRRGKRRNLKPRRKLDRSPSDTETHDDKEHNTQKLDSNDDEIPGQSRVTRTYVRTRRNGEQERRCNESNDSEPRGERREGLRVSARPRISTLHTDYNRSMEDYSWKGKRRSKNKTSWLMLTKVEDGTRYIPQLADEVAYVLQGQDEFLDLGKLEHKGAPKNLRSRLRAVEFCQVVGIEYETIPAFSGVSCTLTLRLIDEDCKAFGKTFRLSLPELTDFPDFIIERRRYEASIKRNWTKRDKCKVWWRTNTVEENGEEKTGEWYIGRVVSVEAKSPEFPDSPWEECIVQYKGDSSGPHRHSPWELFDVDGTEIVESCIDEEYKHRVLSIIEQAESSSCSEEDEYGLHRLSKLLNKPDFLSKTLVPLSLDMIRERLNNNYYRTVDALQHDVQLLATNVQHYLNDNELSRKVQSLADWLIGIG